MGGGECRGALVAESLSHNADRGGATRQFSRAAVAGKASCLDPRELLRQTTCVRRCARRRHSRRFGLTSDFWPLTSWVAGNARLDSTPVVAHYLRVAHCALSALGCPWGPCKNDVSEMLHISLCRKEHCPWSPVARSAGARCKRTRRNARSRGTTNRRSRSAPTDERRGWRLTIVIVLVLSAVVLVLGARGRDSGGR
jgi:hypothetical protein